MNIQITRAARGLWPQKVVGNMVLVGTEGSRLVRIPVYERLGSRSSSPNVSSTGDMLRHFNPEPPEERESDDEMLKDCRRWDGSPLIKKRERKTYDNRMEPQDGTSLNNPRMTGPRTRRTLQESAYVADVTHRNHNNLQAALEPYPLPKNNLNLQRKGITTERWCIQLDHP